MASSEVPSVVVGLFVGGRGSRLGGVAKGNLRLPSGERLAERLLARCAEALPSSEGVLVGAAEAYTGLGLPVLADAPAGIGPLGGLRALLLHAERAGKTHALALSCDLPYLGAALIRRLATESPQAALLAPRSGALWETLVARYSAGVLGAVDAALAASEHALQRVVARLGSGAVELGVNERERAELRDWDTPADAPA